MKYLLIVSALLLLLPYQASAQVLGEQAVVGATGAASVGALYGASKVLSKPNDPTVLALQNQGYVDVVRDGLTPNQYRAVDPRQGPVLISVDPATGQVISVTPK